MKKTTHLLLILLCFAVPVVAQPSVPAVYLVTFDATWSVDTHPTMFPPNAHFSWLIGGTHNDQVSFWDEGDTASLGIRRMAEWGSTSPLDAEVEIAIDLGHAGEVIISNNYPMSPGSVGTTFTVTPATPLATIVTMIAPSPDWFTGVNSLDLRNGNSWVEELVVDLFPYDAGTDSGTAYTSSDQPTVPQIPIAAITGSPFSAGVPVGTMTFTLMTTSTSVPTTGSIDLTAYPNPFNPRTTISFTTLALGPVRVSIYDTRGRLVDVLVDETLNEGQHTISWNGGDLASGVYLARVEQGRQQDVVRLLLTK